MVGASPRPRFPNPYPPTFNGPHLPLSRPPLAFPDTSCRYRFPNLSPLSTSSSSPTLAPYLSYWFRFSRPCAFLQMPMRSSVPSLSIQSAPPIVSSALDDAPFTFSLTPLHPFSHLSIPSRPSIITTVRRPTPPFHPFGSIPFRLPF